MPAASTQQAARRPVVLQPLTGIHIRCLPCHSIRCSAELAVQAAQNELAGAEAGDGRDASNRSLQERLADAQNAQVGVERVE